MPLSCTRASRRNSRRAERDERARGCVGIAKSALADCAMRLRADNPQAGGCTTLEPVIAATRGSFSSLSIEAEGCLDQAIGMAADNATIIFSHLADNASRHHAKSLRIRACRSNNMISVTVANDGEPIAANHRDKIFTPFFTTRRETGGTGMGLEIVRSMLRTHGGSIHLVASEDGVTFLLTFPVA